MQTANQTIGTMSKGDPDRAHATREYRRLCASIRHALALAEHPRTGLDTAMRLRWDADVWAERAREIATDWDLRKHQ